MQVPFLSVRLSVIVYVTLLYCIKKTQARINEIFTVSSVKDSSLYTHKCLPSLRLLRGVLSIYVYKCTVLKCRHYSSIVWVIGQDRSPLENKASKRTFFCESVSDGSDRGGRQTTDRPFTVTTMNDRPPEQRLMQSTTPSEIVRRSVVGYSPTI